MADTSPFQSQTIITEGSRPVFRSSTTNAAIPSTESPRAGDTANGLRWALYLGVSWTWVIGMFLPVLLIRDFGAWAWFAFAIPNIIGAAAMGWAIKSVEHGVRLVANHEAACRVFSLVTIAFHVYFMLWLIPQLLGTTAASIVLGVALVAMANIFTTTLREATLAAIPLVVSLVIAMVAAGRGSLGWPAQATNAAPLDVIGLSGVCILGFLTCPYLDLTFHRARYGCRIEGESKLAFGVGFGVVFASMIVFTLLYASGLLARPFDHAFGILIGTHIAVQAIYTCGIHAAALRQVMNRPIRSNGLTLWIVIVSAALAGLAAQSLGGEPEAIRVGPLVIGEVGYRLFMSFYGLVAPAYVWLCVHPGRGFVRPHRSEVRMTIVACVLAAPFYWIGFIYGPMSWVIPGVAIVFCARFALDYGRRDLLAEQRAAMLMPNDPR